MHIPFEDPTSLGLVIDVAEDIGVSRIVINGDLVDFYSINAHGPKSPLVLESLESELFAAYEFLKDLRKRFPKIPIVYNMGNHEHRLTRFILKNCKAFHNIVSIEKQLFLENLNIEYREYNRKYQLEETNLFIQHSPPSYSVNAAMTSLKTKLDTSSIYGCTHRVQKACLTGDSGNVHSVWMNGWLGSTTLTEGHREVFSYAKGHNNWQQSFMIVTVDNGKEFFVDQIDIKPNGKKRSCVVEGSLYEKV